MAYELAFEKPLAELEKKIQTLRQKGTDLKPSERLQLRRAEQELEIQLREIYGHLSAWQTVQVARHRHRPHTIDYLHAFCDDFYELHGDRLSADNPTIVVGTGRFGGQSVIFLGHEKGRTFQEQRHYNAGMPHPEGFHKARRLMAQAEKFGFPVICLIDTPGASVALEDEERGQGRAIATTLALLARLRTPVLAVVIGEGGSGGALALGIADRVLALEYTYYAVSTPESAASITFRSTKYAPEMAEAQQITARQIKEQGLVDEVIAEPLGGAHRNVQQTIQQVQEALLRHLEEVRQIPLDTLLEQRYQKFRIMGPFAYVHTEEKREESIQEEDR